MRRVLKIVAAVVLLTAVAVVATIALLPTERIASLAADQVRAATGRELTLSGDLSPSVYPVLGIETGAIALSNAEWGEAEELISASGAKVGVELWPLFSGVVKIKEVVLTDPVVSLERRADGVGNWEFAAASAPAEEQAAGDGGGGVLETLSLDKAVIENGSVSFRDEAAGRTISVTEIDAEAALPGFDRPFELAGSAIWNAKPATIDLTLTTPAAALAGEATTIAGTVEAADARIELDATAEPAAAGAELPVASLAATFEVAAADPAGAIAWATGAAAPDGLVGVSDRAASGEVSLSDSGASATLEGGATRDGQPATIRLTAAGGSDWAETQRFDVDLSTSVGSLASVAYQGVVAPGDGSAPAILDGSWRIEAA
ncbi:MAG: AsmA family protein, partial [Pseudomonadota bacterium]